jgi:S-adenosylmethionine:tRNA ribosyltransferase-isomerase
LKTSDFDFSLPETFIAQTPVEPRDASRLLVVHRNLDSIEHVHFFDLPRYLDEGDVLVLNQTKVVAARLYGKKIPTGGQVEILLLKQFDHQSWEVLVGGKRVNAGQRIQIDNGTELSVLKNLEGSRRVVRFDEPITPVLSQIGHVPLPPYIHSPITNPDRYQTIFAKYDGSVAAPTAGLHFTEPLTQELEASGVILCFVTLHIGLDTFAPVVVESPGMHPIHSEWCQLDQETAKLINSAREKGKKIIAVGTTSVRTLETAYWQSENRERLCPYEGVTNLFITPGYRFQTIDALITNFHLPRSTLIMMVSAFYNRKRLISIYETAKQMNYRFYSFGDAMLLL